MNEKTKTIAQDIFNLFQKEIKQEQTGTVQTKAKATISEMIVENMNSKRGDIESKLFAYIMENPSLFHPDRSDEERKIGHRMLERLRVD